jgi:hypothetical protein
MGRMKTLEGIAKKHGKEAFLECARYYSCHVKDTVADTIYEMESRWYDRKNMIKESDKMLDDYNSGNCILTEPPCYAYVDMGGYEKQ